MSESDEESKKRVVVRKYGLLQPLDWGPDCDAELNRMMVMWNRLVEVERVHKERYFALTNEDEEVAELDTEIKALMEERAGLVAEKKARSKAARKRVVSDDFKERIEGLGLRIKELVPVAKAARSAARERMKPALTTVEEQRRAEVKKCRQQSGLWWGNYNAVASAYEKSRSRAMATGGELRWKHANGEGRVVNQIQGGMTIEELFLGRHAIARIIPVGDAEWQWPAYQHARRQPQLRMTIYTGKDDAGKMNRRTVTWPIILHRPIPEDVRIKEIVVTRRRLAHHWRWEVVITSTMGSKTPIENSHEKVAAVNFGFRVVNDGLRVATYSKAGEPVKFLNLPKEISDGFESLADVRSRRDLERDKITAGLRAMDKSGAPEDLEAMIEEILRAPRPSPGQLAALAIAWRAHDWDADARAGIERWRKADKRAWGYEVNKRDKLLARRADYYRKFAAQFVADVAVIILDPIVPGSRKKESAAGEPSPLTTDMRRYANIAATYSLRKAIVDAAEKKGVKIVTDKEAATFKCHACSTEFVPRDRGVLMQTCRHCFTTMDQDQNNCETKLKRYSARAVVVGDAGLTARLN